MSVFSQRPFSDRTANWLRQGGLHPLLARLYAARGVDKPEELSLDLKQLLSPTELKNCISTATLLADILERKDPILVVADYDCDGATACAVALRGLNMLGGADTAIQFLVPNRFTMGYGLTPEVVDLAAQQTQKPKYLITVDNGIASEAGVDRACELGMEVIVTDHHLPGDRLPKATAIVNPNQPGCSFPSKALAGVGVMFYLLVALRAELRKRGAVLEQHIVDALLVELGDVHEALDPLRQLHEGAEVGNLGDGSLDEVADLEFGLDLLPGIGLELLHAQADALVGLVDVDDDSVHLVALLEDFARVVDLLGPAEVGDVHHAVDALLQLHEGAVGGHVADLSADLLADHVALLDLVPRIRLKLADTEGDLLILLVDAEYDGLDFLSEGEDVGRTADALGPAEFGNVDESLNAVLELHESAVGHKVRDLALDLLADREALIDALPGIGLELLEAEADALLVLVDLEDHHGKAVAGLDGLARMGEAGPGHVGDVEESVDAVQIKEGAEVGDVLHRTLDLVSGTHGAEELLASFAALGLDELAAAEDDVLAVLVELHDLEIVGVADEGGEVLRWIDVDLGSGEEGLDADVDDETTLHDGFDAALDDAFGLEQLDDLGPVLALGGLLLGEDDHALVVFEALEENLDLVTDLDFLRVVEFGCGNHTLGLVADVDEEFLGALLEDVPFHDASFTVVFDRGGD